MIYDQEPEPFEISSALASFDQNSVHNISPIRDMDYFRSEWKHSPLYQSVINRYLVPRYFHYIPIRGDGNCAYRATFVRYIQLLLCKEDPQIVANFIENIEDEKGVYQSQWCQDFHDKSKPILEKYLKMIEQELREKGVKEALTLFHQMVLLSSEFDQGLIKLLRIMVANFIREHKSDCFNGLPFEFIIDQKFTSLEDYVNKEVMKMGEEAQDLAIMLLPVVLRIGVMNVMISSEANDGIKEQEYSAKTDQTKMVYNDGLNFHNGEDEPNPQLISLFFRPGHYEILLENEFMKKFPLLLKTFEFMKQVGYTEQGAFIQHMSFMERMSEESKKEEEEFEIIKVKLHCSHEFEREKFIDSLKESFEFDAEKPNIESFFEDKEKEPSIPQCQKCQSKLSFNDFLEIWPERKFTRRSYVTAKSNYEEQMNEIIKANKQRQLELKESLFSEEGKEIEYHQENSIGLMDEDVALRNEERKDSGEVEEKAPEVNAQEEKGKENEAEVDLFQDIKVIRKMKEEEKEEQPKEEERKNDEKEHELDAPKQQREEAPLNEQIGQEKNEEEVKEERKTEEVRPRLELPVAWNTMFKILVGAILGIGGVVLIGKFFLSKKLYRVAKGTLAFILNWR